MGNYVNLQINFWKIFFSWVLPSLVHYVYPSMSVERHEPDFSYTPTEVTSKTSTISGPTLT